MTDRLFICYAHTDSGQISTCVNWLRDAGYEPWLDDKITGGSVWRDSISDAIESAAALVFFISSHSITSDHCCEEVDFALELNVPILSVYLEQTILPNRLLFRLSNRQAIESYKFANEDYEARLIRAVTSTIRSTHGDPQRTDESGADRIERLLVLPFRNLSGDSEQDFFCDGLTEEIINRLGRLHRQRLGVIARSSSMLYKDMNSPISEIAAELGVNYVLEGSVRLIGDRVRVSVNLARTRDQIQLWSDVYDRILSNAFDVQDEIANGVAQSLQIVKVDDLPERSSGTAAAREAYLKGRFHWYQHGAGDYPIAIAYFEEAIAHDPGYAPAYVGLADAIGTQAHSGEMPPEEVYPESKRLVEKALTLDDSAPEPHDLKGRILFAHDFDSAGAEREFKRAIKLNPNYPDAHVIFAQLLAATGRREEAMESVQRGLKHDPHNLFFQVNFGMQLAGTGRCEEAINVFEQLPAGLGIADEMLWGACYRAKLYTKALEAFRKFMAADAEVQAMLPKVGSKISANCYYRLMHEIADNFIARSEDQYLAPSKIARFYVHAEEFDSAIHWLHKAIERHDSYVVYSAVMADYYKLWDVPEFAEVRRRMDLALH